MRTLFILGNGFDIQLGFKTDYPSFYSYYISIDSENEAIQKMKEDMKVNRHTTWADLELGLGKFSKQCTKEEFLDCIADIKFQLQKYLQEETKGKHVVCSAELRADITHPEKYLDQAILKQYTQSLNVHLREQNMTDAITLNYTNSLEQIISSISYSGNDYISNLIHVHGTLDLEMNMGVNDVTQIANKSIVDDDFVEDFVKPEFNAASFNDKNAQCENLINNANVIVLFGVSMGETDKKWWQLIGKRVASKQCVLIKYEYNPEYDVITHPNHKRRWTNEILNNIAKKLELPNDTNSYKDNICIGINKQIFSSAKVEEDKAKIHK